MSAQFHWLNHPSAVQQRRSGFTLIELLIALVVLGVIVSLALPSFNDSIRKGRRSEAYAALAQVQQAQERWRANNAQYASNTQLTLPVTAAIAGDPVGLGLPSSSSGGLYAISIDSQNATTYNVVAAAVSGKSQANDGNCVRLRVRSDGGNIFYGAAAASGSFDESAGNLCWRR